MKKVFCNCVFPDFTSVHRRDCMDEFRFEGECVVCFSGFNGVY